MPDTSVVKLRVDGGGGEGVGDSIHDRSFETERESNEAFALWKRLKRIRNFKLPGLHAYTPEQLFFLAYGRLWRDKVRPAELLNLLRTDPHSPGKWLINGVAQNSPDFAKAFKCKAGAPLNPANKCKVW
ncbi:MAG: hypothetical protein JOS17DRAFT_798090 [Linnemannia elongata]|nr:MAG: hypothetical protein JOS17DRAFT_798090 [Linnemannia elongata]